VRREAVVHPHEALRGWLAVLDPAAAERINAGDRYRTLRALEAALAVRQEQTPPPARESTEHKAPLRLDIIVLQLERERLAARVGERVRAMFDAGLVAEALAVARAHPGAPALTGIGYAEALAYASGLATRDEAITSTIKRTRAYAKRQQTWFRRLETAVRINAEDPGALCALRSHARESARAT